MFLIEPCLSKNDLFPCQHDCVKEPIGKAGLGVAASGRISACRLFCDSPVLESPLRRETDVSWLHWSPTGVLLFVDSCVMFFTIDLVSMNSWILSGRVAEIIIIFLGALLGAMSASPRTSYCTWLWIPISLFSFLTFSPYSLASLAAASSRFPWSSAQ